MKTKFIFCVSLIVALISCGGNKIHFDASGTFEADEVIVSSEMNGKILSLDIEEGDTLTKDKMVGSTDAGNIVLQKEQMQASIEALVQKKSDINPQVKLLHQQLQVQESQLVTMKQERTRTENLIKQDAATGKQLDDINAQIDVLQKQMAVTQQQIIVQRSNISTQNRAVMSEEKPLEKRVAQLNEQLQKANIINPINGTVITKYAEAGEVASAGKALYKIADLSTIYLRAYITGSQLSQIKLGQQVKVLIDDLDDKYKEYPGTIKWISGKAEFTPKTIQTKEERANLVYAIKVKVKNDGYLKIGMYGEVKFE